MVFIMKVNNIQEKKFEPGWLTAPVQFLVNMGQKRGNTMQIFQIMENCDRLINVNRIDVKYMK